jgi:acyl-coenzyme A synthetase/AMP-(fatty) acid ligase
MLVRKVAPNLHSYDEERRTFSVDVPDVFNPVLEIVEGWAAEAPDEVALVSLGPEGELVAEHTAEALAMESRSVARALRALGVRQGDPVFVMLPRIPAWYAAVLGAIRIGAVVVPGTNQLTSRDIGFRLRAVDAVAAITGTPDKIDAIEGQWHERATVVQVALGKPDPHTILSILGNAKITSFCAPPTLYRLLVQAPLRDYDLSTVRHCTSAGEPLNPEVIRAWEDGVGLTIYDGYGQSETSCLVANFRGMEVRPGSMGKPVPGWTVEVLDDDGQVAADGTVGSIAVRVSDPRPVGLFEGYYRDEDASAAAFRDGWYYTGDKAWRDGEGYLWFEGRADDVITSAAYRIGPFEVESALVEHPAVVEAAVVGKPDPERTQIVCAFVVLSAGFEPSDALSEELPKTISGKIRRGELRGRLAGNRGEWKPGPR